MKIRKHKNYIFFYIADLITPVADPPSWASLRTALSGDLYVPRTRRRFGDRAFAVVAPRVWNSLPTDIKLHRTTITLFKRRLKTVLFNRGFAEYLNDSVMRFRSFSRKHNMNTLVTVITLYTRVSPVAAWLLDLVECRKGIWPCKKNCRHRHLSGAAYGRTDATATHYLLLQ